jgi:hypothetical protein
MARLPSEPELLSRILCVGSSSPSMELLKPEYESGCERAEEGEQEMDGEGEDEGGVGKCSSSSSEGVEAGPIENEGEGGPIMAGVGGIPE